MKEIFDGRFRRCAALIVFAVILTGIMLNFQSVFGFIKTIIGLFMPLIVGGAFAFILNVPMNFFEDKIDYLTRYDTESRIRRFRSPIALFVTFALLIVAVAFIIYVIAPNVAESAKSIAHSIEKAYPSWLEYFRSKGINVETFENLGSKLDIHSLTSMLSDKGSSLFKYVSSTIGNVFSTAANIVIGIVMAIYILLSKEKLGRQSRRILYSYVRKDWADEFVSFCSLVYDIFAKFLSGQCVEAVIIGSLFTIVLTIGRFPYSVTIGVVIGAFSLLPIIGAFIGAVFGVILLCTISIKKAIIFVIIYMILQHIEGHFIYPKVVGGSIGLPPLWTLLAVLIGAEVAGIVGILLFIPGFSVIYALLKIDTNKQLKKKKLKIE